ncbi:DUF2795 domain-containing protein [Haloferax mediterranei ATCC 33500]|uniref:DUF2795 domain-containing protein n=1 Tax=Haloferax mediterranei (strain ATCC 33500 / DSM 1411 / JCM 8866 / NBRC 14739 / NCIMB 2177 / R-4) TaxID=523841 RepID=I3R0T2_HALMT|nr:hypothetical protein [Haloferax mediterranei]AFK17842.1 hypothetical protein HFX_0100 [Haloferax mediterranei ATCC 33500]AHZ22733.1 hypothetical protein BM92_08780 [Haloferax mediterranei ATCC 33500]EMA02885.1 hypothetical protein C439_09890 [Haloferax mediterranei ATCC 33500]MDX5987930.1 DUF2795 domain-containing protein [Haloferax mediterranei ATCC 33500]QCQ74401.1 DUF2795 domain-containing protein [Haloferax mediterranei ATCC 33500]
MRLNGLGDAIERHEYPTSSTDFAQHYGDEVIELQNGQETVAEILARLGEETYTCPQDVRDALFTGVGHEAIGRRYYSDRDPSPFGEDGPQMLSF